MTPIYPPQAERALISCILIDPDGVVLAECKRIFGSDNPFYDIVCSQIYKVILTTGETDLLVLSENTPTLTNSGDPLLILMEIHDTVPTSANFSKYLNLVLDCWRRRAAISILSNSQGVLGQRGTCTTKCLSDTAEALKRLSVDTARKRMNVSEVWQEEINRVNSGERALLSLGYNEWDSFLGYREPGDHIVIGARPGVGKTLFMNNMMRLLGKRGFSVGCFSLEQSIPANYARMIGAEARIDTNAVMFNSNSEARKQAEETILGCKFFWEDNAATTIDDIESITQDWVRSHNIQYLFIDYLQNVRGGVGNEERLRVKNISERITALTKDLGLVTIDLAQLNRTEGEPTIKELKESGQIEQDAHLVGLILRQPITEEDTHRILKGESLPVKVHWAKNRRGPQGYSTMNCYFKYCELVGRITHEDVEAIRS